MVKRGIRFTGAPIAVLDGSSALRQAVLAHFPQADVQRCLVHKERNIRGYLPQKYRGHLSSFFNRFRNAEGAELAGEIYDELHGFLQQRSFKAAQSLKEAEDDHKLGCPSTLNSTLLNTNCIENAFRNSRRKIDRVNRWRAEYDQTDR